MTKRWVDKYKLTGIEPGRIFVPGLGEIDLANEKTPIEKVDQVYSRGCKYLELIRDPKSDAECGMPAQDEKAAALAVARKSRPKA